MEPQMAEALSHLTTGIYVLTVREGEILHGMSSSWVTQISGIPPLIMVAVDQRHYSHGVLTRQGVFGLNVVGVKGKELEEYFFSAASRTEDNVKRWEHDIGITGVPLLKKAMAVLECRIVASFPAGDHTLFVGEIVAAEVREKDRPLTSLDLPYVYVGMVIPRSENASV